MSKLAATTPTPGGGWSKPPPGASISCIRCGRDIVRCSIGCATRTSTGPSTSSGSASPRRPRTIASSSSIARSGERSSTRNARRSCACAPRARSATTSYGTWNVSSTWRSGGWTPDQPESVEPVSLRELAGKVPLGEVLEVLVGEGVQLVLEAAREHPLDLFLPTLLLEPRVAEELLGAGDVLVVELDADVARQPVRFGIGARQPDELRLGNRHALALEGEVDRALLDDRVDVVAPRVVVDHDVDGKIFLLVQPAREAPDAAGWLSVAREQHAVVRPPELVLGEPVPLRALLDQQDEVRGAATDLQILGLDDGRDRVAALAEPRAVHAIAVVHEYHGPDDRPGVFGPHVQLLAERLQRHLEVLDERIGLVLGVERVLVRVLDRVLGPVVDLAKRGREIGSLQLAERIGHEDRLHELLGHADVEERPGLLSLPHLDQAPALVEGDVGQGPDGDRERGVLSPLGRGDHHVGHADELLLDRRHTAGLAGHRSPLGLPARRATRRRAFALGPALGLSCRPRPGSGCWVCFRAFLFRRRAVRRHGVLRRVARQHRDLTLDAVRRDDDRVRKTFRATSVPPHELVGLFAAGP